MKFTRRHVLGLSAAGLVLAACGDSTPKAVDTGSPPPPPAGQATNASIPDPSASASEPTAPDTAPAATVAPAGADASSTPQASSAAPPTAAIPEAIDLSAPLVGGGEIDFRTYAGKPLALWFWAPG